MNKERKEIISIIGDYMDKTLSEGCLIEADILDGSYRIILSLTHLDIVIDNDIFIATYDIIRGETKKDIVENKRYLERDRITNKKILGHYDITALEKFLHKNFSGEIDFDLDYIYLYPSQSLSISLSKEELKIPHKPLHLYSGKEDKKLLKILKEI